MKIYQIMNRPVETCTEQDSLNAAAQIMWDCDIGCLPVVNPSQQVIGIITDRDICMAAYTQGRKLKDIPVSGAMSKEVFFCGPEDTISRAEEIMRLHQVRRLPVLDTDQKLLGILSLNDLVMEAEREIASKLPDITVKEVADTLAVVYKPRISGLPLEMQITEGLPDRI
jgi:CBS domain-containing protein